MTAAEEEWVAALLAAAPPLTPGQDAVLRPVCQLMARHMADAPPAEPGGAPQVPATHTQSPGRRSA